MSKPLVTKVSTPLSENVQIGPKLSIFCVAAIIFQQCLNPSFTGCHWSPLPLHRDDITELVDVRDFVLLHLPFEDAPHITLPSASLARALVVLEVCLGVIMLEYFPCGQSPREGNHASASVCHSTCWHSWFPSMNCSSPVPAALMQLQTMRLPPPYLTVSKTHLSLYSSPGSCHTCLTPSELK